MHKSSISSVEIATGTFMLLFSSLLLPTFFFFPFTLLYFNAFHFFPLSFHVRYFHVRPLSVHILSLSLHAMSKSSQIEYSECMTLATLVVTIYMYEYWKTNIHSYKSIFFRVRAISLSFLFTFLSCVFIILWVSCHFLPCSFHFRQSYRYFTFILLKFRSFPFVLSCPSDVPLISLSVRLIFLLIFLSCPFHFTLLSLQFPSLFPPSHSIFSCMSCHFFKIILNFRAYSFQIMFMILGSFHDLPCSFMHRGANSLCDNVQQF